jgi:hypothetical protein
LDLWAVFAGIICGRTRKTRSPTETNEGQSAERQFSASKRKKEGESAFPDFIGFYFIYRIVGTYGFYPGIGRIIHPRAHWALLNAFVVRRSSLVGNCQIGYWKLKIGNPGWLVVACSLLLVAALLDLLSQGALEKKKRTPTYICRIHPKTTHPRPFFFF